MTKMKDSNEEEKGKMVKVEWTKENKKQAIKKKGKTKQRIIVSKEQQKRIKEEVEIKKNRKIFLSLSLVQHRVKIMKHPENFNISYGLQNQLMILIIQDRRKKRRKQKKVNERQGKSKRWKKKRKESKAKKKNGNLIKR